MKKNLFTRLPLGLLLLFLLFNTTITRAQTPIVSIHTGLPRETTKRIVYGNGIYLACLLYPVRFFASTDGTSWSPVTAPIFGDSVLPNLAYGAGLFVCVADSGKIFTSPDGAAWARRSSGETATLRDVEFLQDAFYAVGDSATFLHSADGFDWDPVNTGMGLSTNAYTSLAYGNGHWVITASSPNIDRLARIVYSSGSGSLLSWIADTIALVTNLKFLKDQFYVFGDGVQISTDAVSWTNITPANPIFINETYSGFYDSSKIYVVNAGNVYASITDSTFDQNAILFTLDRFTDALYANHTYLLYGQDGIVSSPDGVNYHWGGAEYGALASDGHGYVGVGTANVQGDSYTSPDFNTWTEGTPLPYQGLYGVIYDGSRYVISGADGNGNSSIYGSPDGITLHYLGPQIIQGENTPIINKITYGAGEYVGYGLNTVAVSGDAGIWHAVSSFPFPPPVKIKFLNGAFLGITTPLSGNGLLNSLIVSTDGNTWTDITPHLPFMVQSFNDIVYDGSRYTIMGEEEDGSTGGFFSVSTDSINNPGAYGVKGTVTAPPAGAILKGSSFAYSAGRFVGGVLDTNKLGSGYLLYSTDALHWDNTPLGTIGGDFTGIVSNADTFRLLTQSNVQVTAVFSGVALPVTLLDFEATAVGRSTLLSWETATEENSSRFTVQRSPDGTHWAPIGAVAAAGQSFVIRNYQFTDDSPQIGYDYYRLLITDLDGRTVISPVKRVSFGNDRAFTVYPNPVPGSVLLELPESAAGVAVLYNATGAEVLRQEFNGYTVTLSLQGLASGVYHVVVQQSGKQYTREIFHP